jgi:hypothetical protein
MRVMIPAAAAALVLATSASAAPTNQPAWQSTIKYSTTSTGASGYGNYARATSKVVYDPVAGTYVVRDTGSLTTTATFGPSSLISSAGNFSTYGTPTNSFRRLNQSPSNTLIALTYVDYGQWRPTSTAGGTTSVNDTYLVWGSRTPNASIPRTGSAAYSTVVDGTFVNKDGAYAVNGSGTFTANFLGSSINYSQTATGTKEVGTGTITFGTMTGAGSINFRSGVFNGTGVADAEGYKMDLTGNFYGPAADEIGGLFRITGNGGNGQGAIVGVQP